MHRLLDPDAHRTRRHQERTPPSQLASFSPPSPHLASAAPASHSQDPLDHTCAPAPNLNLNGHIRLGPHIPLLPLSAPTFPRILPRVDLADDERALEGDRVHVARDMAPGTDEVPAGDDVPSEDERVVRRQAWALPDRGADEHDEPVPRAHAAVYLEVAPRERVLPEGLDGGWPKQSAEGVSEGRSERTLPRR